jgi:hypothetical protein
MAPAARIGYDRDNLVDHRHVHGIARAVLTAQQ